MNGKMYMLMEEGTLVLQAFVIRQEKQLHVYSYSPDQFDSIMERIMDHSLRDDYPLEPKLAVEILTAMEEFQRQNSETTWPN